jgi:hypothetical protein
MNNCKTRVLTMLSLCVCTLFRKVVRVNFVYLPDKGRLYRKMSVFMLSIALHMPPCRPRTLA